MVKGPMEFQMSAAEPHSQCAMVYQELMDTQVLIVLHHHFQHVVLITVDSQEETANSELAQHHQVLQLSCNWKRVSQPALIDTPSTANQFALNLKQLAAPNQELQLLNHWTLGPGEIDSKEPRPGITPP